MERHNSGATSESEASNLRCGSSESVTQSEHSVDLPEEAEPEREQEEEQQQLSNVEKKEEEEEVINDDKQSPMKSKVKPSEKRDVAAEKQTRCLLYEMGKRMRMNDDQMRDHTGEMFANNSFMDWNQDTPKIPLHNIEWDTQVHDSVLIAMIKGLSASQIIDAFVRNIQDQESNRLSVEQHMSVMMEEEKEENDPMNNRINEMESDMCEENQMKQKQRPYNSNESSLEIEIGECINIPSRSDEATPSLSEIIAVSRELSISESPMPLSVELEEEASVTNHEIQPEVRAPHPPLDLTVEILPFVHSDPDRSISSMVSSDQQIRPVKRKLSEVLSTDIDVPSNIDANSGDNGAVSNSEGYPSSSMAEHANQVELLICENVCMAHMDQESADHKRRRMNGDLMNDHQHHHQQQLESEEQEERHDGDPLSRDVPGLEPCDRGQFGHMDITDLRLSNDGDGEFTPDHRRVLPAETRLLSLSPSPNNTLVNDEEDPVRRSLTEDLTAVVSAANLTTPADGASISKVQSETGNLRMNPRRARQRRLAVVPESSSIAVDPHQSSEVTSIECEMDSQGIENESKEQQSADSEARSSSVSSSVASSLIRNVDEPHVMRDNSTLLPPLMKQLSRAMAKLDPEDWIPDPILRPLAFSVVDDGSVIMFEQQAKQEKQDHIWDGRKQISRKSFLKKFPDSQRLSEIFEVLALIRGKSDAEAPNFLLHGIVYVILFRTPMMIKQEGLDEQYESEESANDNDDESAMQWSALLDYSSDNAYATLGKFVAFTKKMLKNVSKMKIDKDPSLSEYDAACQTFDELRGVDLTHLAAANALLRYGVSEWRQHCLMVLLSHQSGTAALEEACDAGFSTIGREMTDTSCWINFPSQPEYDPSMEY